MKKAVIVHCWGGKPQYCWYPQAKKDLEKMGMTVIVPEMPNTNNPQMASWLSRLHQLAGTPNEELYFIGHSLGCITIMRYLELLGEQEKVGGVVFVAGFTDDLGYKELTNFFATPIDFAKIRTKAAKFIAIASDNDPYVPIKYADILNKELGAEIILKENMGHFSGPLDNPNSCTDLPEIKAVFSRIPFA